MKLLLENWRQYVSKITGNYENEWRAEIKNLVVKGKGLPVTHMTSKDNLEDIKKSGYLKAGNSYGDERGDGVWFTVGHSEQGNDWGMGGDDIVIQGYIPEDQLELLKPDELPMGGGSWLDYSARGELFKDALYWPIRGTRKKVDGSPVFINSDWNTENISRVIVLPEDDI